MSGFGRLLWVAGILALVSLSPCATVLTAPPDAPTPAELVGKLEEAKRVVVHSLDRPSWTRARFIGFETRASDDLVVLMFELYGWPNFLPVRAFLISRCRPIAAIDPRMMGGGLVEDFAKDPELKHLRSPAQQPCPSR